MGENALMPFGFSTCRAFADPLGQLARALSRNAESAKAQKETEWSGSREMPIRRSAFRCPERQSPDWLPHPENATEGVRYRGRSLQRAFATEGVCYGGRSPTDRLSSIDIAFLT